MLGSRHGRTPSPIPSPDPDPNTDTKMARNDQETRLRLFRLFSLLRYDVDRRFPP